MWTAVIEYIWKITKAVVDSVHMIADKITVQTQNLKQLPDSNSYGAPVGAVSHLHHGDQMCPGSD